MSMIAIPSHTLIFGGITMVEEGANPPDASGVTYHVRSQDTTFGNPAPVTVALLSLMRAGSLVAYDRTDNRAPVLRVTIKADDSDLLARGEKALQLECEKSNTLTWIPPDGAGEPSVFDVVWSSLELVFDDVQELLRQRVYLVRLQALPHARSQLKVVTPAQPTATDTLIDNGSSVTGWALVTGASIASTAGKIVLTTNTPLTSGFTAFVASGEMTRTGTVSLTTAKYIKVTWSLSVANSTGLTVKLDGVTLTEASRTVSGGSNISYYTIPAGVTTVSVIDFAALWTNVSVAQTLSVDQVDWSTGIPFIGTARQKALSLVPGGSAPTAGSIQVSHASNALGKTAVYTHKSGTGYLPPLRRWLLSSGTVTADSTLLSGSRNPIGATTTIYQIPVSALPEGRVELWAWLRTVSGTGAKTIDWAVASFMGTTLLSYDLRAASVTLAVLNTWYLVPLGVAVMPPVKLGPAGYIQVHLHHANTDVEVDEAYLFATDHGRLTILDCGTGSPAAGAASNRLWVDAPDQDQPTGGIYRGNAADRSDAWHAGAAADVWEVHDFDPTGTNMFVATQNTIDAETSLEHYKRFHTHVARED